MSNPNQPLDLSSAPLGTAQPYQLEEGGTIHHATAPTADELLAIHGAVQEQTAQAPAEQPAAPAVEEPRRGRHAGNAQSAENEKLFLEAESVGVNFGGKHRKPKDFSLAASHTPTAPAPENRGNRTSTGPGRWRRMAQTAMNAVRGPQLPEGAPARPTHEPLTLEQRQRFDQDFPAGPHSDSLSETLSTLASSDGFRSANKAEMLKTALDSDGYQTNIFPVEGGYQMQMRHVAPDGSTSMVGERYLGERTPEAELRAAADMLASPFTRELKGMASASNLQLRVEGDRYELYDKDGGLIRSTIIRPTAHDEAGAQEYIRNQLARALHDRDQDVQSAQAPQPVPPRLSRASAASQKRNARRAQRLIRQNDLSVQRGTDRTQVLDAEGKAIADYPNDTEFALAYIKDGINANDLQDETPFRKSWEGNPRFRRALKAEIGAIAVLTGALAGVIVHKAETSDHHDAHASVSASATPHAQATSKPSHVATPNPSVSTTGDPHAHEHGHPSVSASPSGGSTEGGATIQPEDPHAHEHGHPSGGDSSSAGSSGATGSAPIERTPIVEQNPTDTIIHGDNGQFAFTLKNGGNVYTGLRDAGLSDKATMETIQRSDIADPTHIPVNTAFVYTNGTLTRV